MKILQIIRIIYHLVAFTIFIIQAKESLNKYFQYPVVIQKSWTSVDMIRKPDVQICFQDYFDYDKALTYGYSSFSKFLAGLIPNSSKPTWMGIHKNSTYKEIQKVVHKNNFSRVVVNQPTKLSYILNKGFCLHTNSLDSDFKITTRDKKLKVYISHSSTDPKIMIDKSSNTFIKVGYTSNIAFDYKVYELLYEVHDNTVHDGINCIDYRKQESNYGDCNFKALKYYIHSVYSCYPQWIDDLNENFCETDVKNEDIGIKLHEQIWKDIDRLTDRRRISLMKQCLPPCYQVKIILDQKQDYPYWKNNAELTIYEEIETVQVFKAVHSFDIFTLAVELGSALGLWLGNFS